MPFRDRILLAAIRLLRALTLALPFERGRWLIAAHIRKCARGLAGEYHIIVRSRDRRKFRINLRERQYHMGLLDMGEFEPAETRVLARCIAAGDVVVDAGANYGWYTTMFSAAVGAHGEVHAFEPAPHTADSLEDACTINGCRNVRINRCALGERNESCVLYLRPGQPSGDATLFPASDVDAGMRACDCDVTTLDHYFTTRKLTRCDLVKCDVEGAELFFVRGAKGVLSKHRPIVMIEVNSMSLRRAGTTGREVLDEIASCASYLFFRIEAPSGRLVGMEPVDCEAIQHYANVLCIPVHSRALDRLGIEMRRPPHPWSDANPPPSRSSTIGGPHRSHIRPQCTESFIA